MASTTNLKIAEGEFLSISLIGKHFHIKVRNLTLRESMKRFMSEERFNIKGQIWFQCMYEPRRDLTNFVFNLPEAQWDNKTESYKTPLTDSIAVQIDRVWPRSQVTFNSGACAQVFESLLKQFDSGRSIAIQAARFKAEGKVPDLPDWWQEKSDLPLSDYQRTAVKLAMDTDSFALFMDRGTGKTACSVQYVCTLARMVNSGNATGGTVTQDGKKMIRVLVIVPTNVRLNWTREFTKFAHVKGKVAVLRGGLHKRIQQLADAITPSIGCQFSVLVAGYDGVVNTEDYFKLVEWDAIITDEAHYYKDPNTARFKSLKTFRDSSARRLALTGSPIGNSPMDLWSQLEFLREGLSGFTSYRTFRAYHGIWQKTSSAAGHGVSKLVGLNDIPLLQERLSRCSFSVSKEEAGLNLPDKTYSVVEVDLTKEQKTLYRTLENELAAEIEDKLSGDVNQVTVTNVLTMLLRLAQITSGYITYDAQLNDDGEVVVPKRIVNIGDANPKLDAALELLQVDRDPDAKTIIWCHFVPNILMLSEALTKAGIGHVVYYGSVTSDARDRNVDQFNNDPNCKVFIGNPQTAGEGLNLLGYDTTDPENSHGYCDMEIFYSIGWSAILRGQAEDRAHRRGTRMPVSVVDLVAPGTIDEEILDRVQGKIDMATTVTDLMPILKRVLVNQ